MFEYTVYRFENIQVIETTQEYDMKYVGKLNIYT